MRFGLKETTISQINTVLAQYPQVEQAILYGSRAKGNHKPGSDIDLTLIGDQIDLWLIHKIETELDDHLLPYTVDISAYHHLTNPRLVDHIDRMGKLFYRAVQKKAWQVSGERETFIPWQIWNVPPKS